MDVVAGFRAVVRAALGMPTDPGVPPDLMRLGLYRAQVMAASSDGSKLDLQPEDARISPEKNVPVRVGIPGAVAVVTPGAVVLLGWERGDPARPYCVPSWEAGATVTKTVFNASELHLGSESGSDGVVTKKDLQFLYFCINNATPVAMDGGAALKAAILLALAGGGWSSDPGDGQLGSSKVKGARL